MESERSAAPATPVLRAIGFRFLPSRAIATRRLTPCSRSLAVLPIAFRDHGPSPGKDGPPQPKPAARLAASLRRSLHPKAWHAQGTVPLRARAAPCSRYLDYERAMTPFHSVLVQKHSTPHFLALADGDECGHRSAERSCLFLPCIQCICGQYFYSSPTSGNHPSRKAQPKGRILNENCPESERQ